MKKLSLFYLFILVNLLLSCRKQQIILESTAFSQGKYFYDYSINGHTYENYKTMQIEVIKEGSLKEVFISGKENYEIPEIEKELSSFWGRSGTYYLTNGSLYDRFSSNCSSMGFAWNPNYFLYIPSYHLGVKRVELYACEGKYYGAHTITNYDDIITIRGVNYKTYRMEFYRSFQFNEPKLVGYFDEKVGLIQLEKFDYETNQLVSTLTFNHKEK